jgi:hypothetical protein
MKSVKIIEEVDSVEMSHTTRRTPRHPNPLSPKNNNDLFHIIQNREAINFSYSMIDKAVDEHRSS